MTQVLAGVIVAYDAINGFARIKARGRLRTGDLVRVVGANTDKELKLTIPLASTGDVIQAILPGAQVGDMVLRLVGPIPVLAAA